MIPPAFLLLRTLNILLLKTTFHFVQFQYNPKKNSQFVSVNNGRKNGKKCIFATVFFINSHKEKTYDLICNFLGGGIVSYDECAFWFKRFEKRRLLFDRQATLWKLTKVRSRRF